MKLALAGYGKMGHEIEAVAKARGHQVVAIFDIDKLLTEVAADRRYHEFLRVPAMSAGVYVLPAGAADKQSPHKEDEIYYAVRGRGKIRIGGQETPVSQGSVVFVNANAEQSVRKSLIDFDDISVNPGDVFQIVGITDSRELCFLLVRG